MARSNLLATAGTLEGILSAIADFYCGSEKTLIADGENRWKVAQAEFPDDAPLIGVQVVYRRGRYRFEMVI